MLDEQTNRGGICWTTEQLRLTSRNSSDGVPARQHQPSPQVGGATDAVLRVLASAPGRWLTYGQILSATKRTHAATSWGLLRLRAWGFVEVIADDYRNERYLKYRFLDGDARSRLMASKKKPAGPSKTQRAIS